MPYSQSSRSQAQADLQFCVAQMAFAVFSHARTATSSTVAFHPTSGPTHIEVAVVWRVVWTDLMLDDGLAGDTTSFTLISGLELFPYFDAAFSLLGYGRLYHHAASECFTVSIGLFTPTCRL